ncbi:calcium-transporting ATPase sarcoplasmic/endoplasmic reticulum type, putative, partial [Perkinsus marinus ATCC 50983]
MKTKTSRAGDKKLDDDTIRRLAYARNYQETLDFFNVTLEKGLSDAQVQAQAAKFGPNELDKTEGKSLLALILEQFDDLMVKILLVAAFISFLLAYFDDENNDEGMLAYVEPLVILLILIANAIVGVWQETNAEAALEALKSLQPSYAH